MNYRQYTFQPFKFQTLHKNYELFHLPLGISDWVVCNDEILIAYQCPKCTTGEARLWKFYFDSLKWKRIICQGLPENLTFTSVILTGSLIFIYGISLGDVIYNQVYYGNLDDDYKQGGIKIKELKISSPISKVLKEYSLGVVLDGSNIFVVVGRPGSNDIELDVLQFNLKTKTWIKLYKTVQDKGPDQGNTDQIVFYNNRIYMFHSKNMTETLHSYNFSQIHTFNLATNQWEILPAQEDYNYKGPCPGYPINRIGQNCFQCPKNKNWVYLCGGYSDYCALYDMWRLDLNTTQWEYLPKFIMPVSLFNTYSMAVSKSGRMCCYGGRVNKNSDSNDITSAWIVIPKLEVICWEAMIFYFKDHMITSSNDKLKKLGLPIKLYDRMIKAKAINTICSAKLKLNNITSI